MTTIENGMALHPHWDLASCRACEIKGRCAPSSAAASHAGSTRPSSTPCKSGWTANLTPCASAARPSSTCSALRRPGWARRNSKTRRLKNVASEMNLHVLAYNRKRTIALLNVRPLIAALQA